jgi:hypothetical protein
MGARSYELAVADETQLLVDGTVAVDSPTYPIAKQVPYGILRRPITPPQLLKSVPYSMVAGDNGALLVATAAITVTLPIAAALGVGWRCQIYADGAAVTITRAGGASLALAAGELATVMTANNKVLAYKTATPAIL